MEPSDKVKEFAAILQGSIYPFRLSSVGRKLAKNQGIVVVYGASDDLMELDGAISDEFGADNISIDGEGVLPLFENLCADRNMAGLREFFRRQPNATELIPHWDRDGYSFVYEFAAPHATFDIFDEGQKYCRGIVFCLDDLK